MNAPIADTDKFTDLDLMALHASTLDQLRTATSEWERVVSSNDRLEATMALVDSVHAAERRLDRPNAEMARRQCRAAVA
ncbi:hypothetical protein KWH04_01060 [Xanthomonas campestris pv. trichodesmae]|uniref:Uncharacterized protein n=2 Tax=Xanthomonas citri TaxID=346 RepID=A0AB33CEU1_XANCI|nr:hypothetical protein [Xanthomonas citri]ASK91069.1 hypothetical protein XcvCFBP7111P_05750 [Xanthomonas citri pv. vignicola]MBV6779259.1 hypothetical protein [Xanthomonas campestris pv. trichodesmae]MBZ3921773.1 hypothetical protein [Xanthomonas campestris pv. trichodesmae]MBZ3926373.1 hypothetical protein [Xanthomonas citri pv. sesbaniae]